MDSSKTTHWLNTSTGLQHQFHDISDVGTNNASQLSDLATVATPILCGVGLPGNLLVILIYVTKMTSSTRVYLFALAVADTAICVCGIVLTVAPITFMIHEIFMFVINLSIIFSMYLLVFVSVERLIAVRRPLAFSMGTRRANVAVIAIGAASLVLTTVANGSVILKLELVYLVVQLFLLCSTMCVLSTCYILIAITLVNSVRVSHSKIGVINTASTVQRKSTKGPFVRQDASQQQSQPGPSNTPAQSASIERGLTGNAPATKITTKKANQLKNVCLLFTITVIFIACWLPTGLLAVGVAIPAGVTRMFFLNSVVNPFIYGVASAMFREDVRQFYRQTRTKLSAC